MIRKKKVKESKDPITHKLTLDEYDELTMENQVLGAGSERGKIIAELELSARRLWSYSEAAALVPDRDIFAQKAAGLEMAANLVRDLRKYEDNVGCIECGVI